MVVTGLGAVTCIGVGAGEFASGLRAGRSGARPVSAFDASGFDSGVACEIVDFDPAPWLRTLPETPETYYLMALMAS